MSEPEPVYKLTEIIERLPLGRLRAEYVRKREELIANIKEKEEEAEKIAILIDIAKQIKTECFMCKDVIQRFDAKQELTEGNKYHIAVCIPNTVHLKGFKGKVWISISLFIEKVA